MRRTDATAWVVTVCAVSLRLSQAKTLGALVAGALSVQRTSLANIGRALLGRAKHQIKRCRRFCANERVETADAMRGVVKKVLRTRRRRPLVVSFDWTDVTGFQTLMASVVFRGRSVPLCWASCRKHVYDGHRSRNAFERVAAAGAALDDLRGTAGDPPRRPRLRPHRAGPRFCQAHGFDYVIRIQPDVYVRCASYAGTLLDYPVHKGICKLLRGVDYRAHDPVTQHVVVRWVRGRPAKRDECWFLMTSLSAGPARVSRLYGQRMTIEELFRDMKNKRNGWSLRDTRITRADRLDRLLLILALADLLLCGVGLLAIRACRPGHWTAGSKNDCSVFTIGRVMVTRLTASVAQAVRAVADATEDAAPNWG